MILLFFLLLLAWYFSCILHVLSILMMFQLLINKKFNRLADPWNNFLVMKTKENDDLDCTKSSFHETAHILIHFYFPIFFPLLLVGRSNFAMVINQVILRFSCIIFFSRNIGFAH